MKKITRQLSFLTLFIIISTLSWILPLVYWALPIERGTNNKLTPIVTFSNSVGYNKSVKCTDAQLRTEKDMWLLNSTVKTSLAITFTLSDTSYDTNNIVYTL